MKVVGSTEVAATLLGMKDKTLRRVMEAIEKTAVRMASSARAGHEHGSNPHSRDRYENQTNNLTSSLFPGGPNGQPMKWQEITEDRIVGLFGVAEMAPGTPMQYAEYVEEKYPFIWPAVVANMEGFKNELAKAAKPDTK